MTLTERRPDSSFEERLLEELRSVHADHFGGHQTSRLGRRLRATALRDEDTLDPRTVLLPAERDPIVLGDRGVGSGTYFSALLDSFAVLSAPNIEAGPFELSAIVSLLRRVAGGCDPGADGVCLTISPRGNL